MLKLRIPTILLQVSIYFFIFTTVSNAQNFTIGGEVTPYHVPLVNSSLYLDTMVSAFRPSVSISGQDWLLDGSYEERISTSVTSGAKAAKMSESFKGGLKNMPPEFTQTELELPDGWTGLAVHASPFTGDPGRAMVMVERERETILTMYDGIKSQQQLDELLAAMALHAVSDEEKQSNIPFKLNFPEEWPYAYAGNGPIGGHAYQHGENGNTFTITVSPQQEATAESLAKDEASFLQERPDALIEKGEARLLMFSYAEEKSFSPLWSSLSKGNASIAVYGDAMSEADRQTLLEVLRSASLKK